jgi:ankyrin repeat protein
MRTIITLLASVALTHAGELHQAARVCDADRMRQLLSRHPSLNETDGRRPSLNETDENGMTPLHIAIDSRKKACVGLLLEAGADRKARDRQGRSAFDASAQIVEPTDRWAIDYMLKTFGPKAPGEPKGPMPWSLEYEAMHRQTNVTKMMLALGADPNAAGTGGSTPLADAALKGDPDTVRALLAAGARPDAVSRAGTQPIHDAALGDNAEVVRELVKQGRV